MLGFWSYMKYFVFIEEHKLHTESEVYYWGKSSTNQYSRANRFKISKALKEKMACSPTR